LVPTTYTNSPAPALIVLPPPLAPNASPVAREKVLPLPKALKLVLAHVATVSLDPLTE